jgi:hypothetical protein
LVMAQVQIIWWQEQHTEREGGWIIRNKGYTSAQLEKIKILLMLGVLKPSVYITTITLPSGKI